jgi:capsular polysaccharide export protein
MIPFNVRGKRILLLQGPMGPFFRRLADGLLAGGARFIHKINFNGGDRYYFPTGFDFKAPMDQFNAYLHNLIDEHQYDMVCLFGDCRPHHKIARDICAARNVVVMAFEEGYLRPHYVTVEPTGVNGNSHVPRDAESYRRHTGRKIRNPAEQAHFSTRPWAWWQSFSYGLFMRLHREEFPFYQHHRDLSFREGLRWVSWDIRKLQRKSRDRRVVDNFLRWVGDRYFVPLQLASDCQITQHSPYDSIEEFISEVLLAFHLHAAPSAVLLFKHHPLDPYHDYADCINREAERLGLQGRVMYSVHGHLPTILNNCSGVIAINSTVGISALLHRRPLCIRGNAVYGLAGLVTKDLADFMKQPWAYVPDRELFDGFRNYHLATTQAAGNFNRILFKGTKTGLLWPQETKFEQHLVHHAETNQRLRPAKALVPRNTW